MNVNFLAIIIATIAEFVIGAIWYMPLFGTLWGKIHGFDSQSKEAQDQMRKKMMPLLLVQLLITFVTTWVLAVVMGNNAQGWSAYCIAALCWIGFVVPTQVAGVIFGGTNPKWIVTKTLVMAGGSLACLEAAALILSMMSK